MLLLLLYSKSLFTSPTASSAPIPNSTSILDLESSLRPTTHDSDFCDCITLVLQAEDEEEKSRGKRRMVSDPLPPYTFSTALVLAKATEHGMKAEGSSTSCLSVGKVAVTNKSSVRDRAKFR